MIDFVDVVLELIGDHQSLVVTAERMGNRYTVLDIKHKHDGWSQYHLMVYEDGEVKCLRDASALIPKPDNRFIFRVNLYDPNSIPELGKMLRKLTIRL